MTYTVTWTPDAEQELAAIWLQAANRAAVTRAAHEIDQRLGRDPLSEGESRSGIRRILFVWPLADRTDFKSRNSLRTLCPILLSGESP